MPPEQQLVNGNHKTAQRDFPLSCRAGVIADALKEPEFVQGIVGYSEIQQGIAVGGQTPEKGGKKNGGKTVFLPVKPGQQGSGHREPPYNAPEGGLQYDINGLYNEIG